jgi:hypothetical protein
MRMNKMLRRIFGPKKIKVTDDYRKLNNEKPTIRDLLYILFGRSYWGGSKGYSMYSQENLVGEITLETGAVMGGQHQNGS